MHRSSLGLAPDAVCQLNGGAFTQDALVTAGGWQYVALYQDVAVGTRHVTLGRRNLVAEAGSTSTWSFFTFTDYDQTEDDGHSKCRTAPLGIRTSAPLLEADFRRSVHLSDVISVGISPDGVLHLSWDAHDTPLLYR